MDNIAPTSKRKEVIEYLMETYNHIFAIDEHNQEKVRNNIAQMSDIELIYELNILSEFRAKEKGIYQEVLIASIQSSEEINRSEEKMEIPVF